MSYEKRIAYKMLCPRCRSFHTKILCRKPPAPSMCTLCAGKAHAEASKRRRAKLTAAIAIIVFSMSMFAQKSLTECWDGKCVQIEEVK
jgi:hypothetical protein